MSPKNSSSPGTERRRTRRRSVLDAFSLFAVVPKKGPHRLPIRDISDLGIGFDLDIPGEGEADFPLKANETLELQLHLNPSLYLPLQIRIARIEAADENGHPVRRIGAEFAEQGKAPHKGLVAFVEMLDRIADVVQIQQG